jgi:hypothetical protein
MIDERFVMHRYKATRAAVVVGMVLMFVFFTYGYIADSTIRWDFLIVMAAMAVAKVAVMLYFRRTN